MSKGLQIDVQRKLEYTEITLKSEFIEALMKEWSRGRTHSPYDQEGGAAEYVKDYKAYTLTNPPALPSRRNWGNFSHGINANGFNMRLLTLVGLGEGVVVKITTPLSKSMIRDFLIAAKEMSSELVGEYAKPVTGSMSLTIVEKMP